MLVRGRMLDLLPLLTHGLAETLFVASEGGVDSTITCLMPDATETEFFKRADMMDAKIGTAEKDDAAEVAKAGFDAMRRARAISSPA